MKNQKESNMTITIRLYVHPHTYHQFTTSKIPNYTINQYIDAFIQEQNITEKIQYATIKAEKSNKWTNIKYSN